MRSIVDKLIYNDYYSTLDSYMSDAQVGGRKNRNIRDNLFITYGVINYCLKSQIKLDITLYDLAKCFDSMRFEETVNDVWNAGIKDDTFVLIANCPPQP